MKFWDIIIDTLPRSAKELLQMKNKKGSGGLHDLLGVDTLIIFFSLSLMYLFV